MSDPQPPDDGPRPDAPAGGERTGGSDFGKRASRAGLWSLGGYGAGQLLRLVGNLILTRMLFEEAFGLIALVSVFLQALQLFSDLGIGPSIVQHPRGEEPTFLNTAWTIQVVRGFVLFGITWACAIPFAAFYDAPDLAALLPFAGLNAIVSGFNSTNLYVLNRKLALERLMIVEIASQLAGLLAMVGWALVDRSTWALIFGGFMIAFVKMVLSHLVLPGIRHRLRWDRDAGLTLFRQGRWIFLSTALSFLASQSDRLIFAKLIPIATLGVYSVALNMAALPVSAVSRLADSVLFPVLSREFEGSGDRSLIFRRTRLPLMLLGGWVISGTVAGGTAIIELLYDPRYHEAGWMLRVLAAGGWFNLVEVTVMAVLMASGNFRWLAINSGARFLGLVTLLPAGYMMAGFPGALVGFAMTDLTKLIAAQVGAHRDGVHSAMQDLGMTALVALGAAIGAGAAHLVAGALGPEPGLLGEALIVGTALGGATLVWLPQGTVHGLAWLRRRRAGSSHPPAPG